MSWSNSLTILKQQAALAGVSSEVLGYLANTMKAESEGNPTATSGIKGNTAKGLFGFIDSTWHSVCRSHGLNAGERFNTETQCKAALALTMDNAKALKSVLGREATMGELYLAHFAGVGGAKTLLAADDNTPISGLLSATAMQQNAGIKLKSGKRFADWTVADIRYWASVEKMHMSGIAPDNSANETLEKSDGNIIMTLLNAVMDMIGSLFTSIFGGGKKDNANQSHDQNSVQVPSVPNQKPGASYSSPARHS